MKNFVAYDYKCTFVTSGRTPLKNYKDCFDLCCNGGGSNLTIHESEIDIAIDSICKTGIYKDFILSDFITNQKIKEEENTRKNNEYWNKVHDICIENENRLKAKIEEVGQYFNDVLSKQYSTGCIVYNKLEESIKQGYFIIYTGFSNWKHIQLSDTHIKPLELL